MSSYLPKLPLRLGGTAGQGLPWRDNPAPLCQDASWEIGTARGHDRMQALGMARKQSRAGRGMFSFPQQVRDGGEGRKGSFLQFRSQIN